MTLQDVCTPNKRRNSLVWQSMSRLLDSINFDHTTTKHPAAVTCKVAGTNHSKTWSNTSHKDKRRNFCYHTIPIYSWHKALVGGNSSSLSMQCTIKMWQGCIRVRPIPVCNNGVRQCAFGCRQRPLSGFCLTGSAPNPSISTVLKPGKKAMEIKSVKSGTFSTAKRRLHITLVGQGPRNGFVHPFWSIGSEMEEKLHPRKLRRLRHSDIGHNEQVYQIQTLGWRCDQSTACAFYAKNQPRIRNRDYYYWCAPSQKVRITPKVIETSRVGNSVSSLPRDPLIHQAQRRSCFRIAVIRTKVPARTLHIKSLDEIHCTRTDQSPPPYSSLPTTITASLPHVVCPVIKNWEIRGRSGQPKSKKKKYPLLHRIVDGVRIVVANVQYRAPETRLGRDFWNPSKNLEIEIRYYFGSENHFFHSKPPYLLLPQL